MNDTILSDEEVALLNEARTLLATFSKRCATQSWKAETDIGTLSRENLPSAADYGRIHALADVAENGIFTVLNWTNSHHVRALAEEQLHNSEPEPASIIPPALVPVGHEDYPEAEAF